MRKLSRLTVAALLAVGLIGTAAAAGPQWSRYLDRKSGNVVFIKSRCIAAEDSAAHLRLVDYRDGGGTVVYGCSRKGY
jgi:hypothetical protein